MRSGRLVLLLLSSMLFCGVAIARAEAPAGPRLAAISFHPYPNAGSELSSLAPDGSDPFRIAGGSEAGGPSPILGARPSWSADGSRVAFLGAGGDVVLSAAFTVVADGSDPKVVPLSRRLSIWGDPVIAPDGRSVAVMRIEPVGKPFKRLLRRDRGSDGPRARTAIWLLGADDSGMRPLTPWSRGTLLEPSSFSPDGSRLAATEWRGEGATGRAISIDLATRRAKVLARNAAEPVYATDGSVAMVRHRHEEKWRLEELAIGSSTLLVLPAGGGRPRPLVRVRGGLRWPSWDPSGQRIAFTRLRRASRKSPIPGPNSIAEINADGTCLTTVAKLTRGFFAGSAWQPGPGREAGRIAC